MAARSLLAATALCAMLGARAALGCDDLPDEIRTAVEAGDFVQAERLGRASVDLQPDAPGPRIALARVYRAWAKQTAPQAQRIDLARSAQAVELLSEVVERWPELQQPHACLLELRLLREEDEQFLTELADTLALFPAPDPKLMGSLEQLVGLAVKQERGWLSERACAQLVEREDLTVPALSNCGLEASGREDLELARDRFARAHARDPLDTVVAHNLALVQLLLGDLTAAQSTLVVLATLEPANLDPVLQLAVARTALEPARSAAIWKQVVARCDALPAHELAPWLRAFAQATLDALAAGGVSPIPEMARALLEQDAALAASLHAAEAGRQPSDPRAPFLHAQALERAGYPARAFAELERAAAIAARAPASSSVDPGQIDFEAGRVAVKLGRHADAVVRLERARHADDKAPNVEYLLGLAYAGIGDRSSAEREYSACLERDRNTAEYQRWCRKNQAALAKLPAAPVEPSESFASAHAKAKANEAGAGTAYAATALPAIAPSLASAMRSCVPALPPGKEDQRLILLRVAADGSVAEVLQARSDAEPVCFATHLRALHLPAPPDPDWWLVYDIRIEE